MNEAYFIQNNFPKKSFTEMLLKTSTHLFPRTELKIHAFNVFSMSACAKRRKRNFFRYRFAFASMVCRLFHQVTLGVRKKLIYRHTGLFFR